MLTCRQCGQQNLEEARFCMACATPLASADGATREVRKTVTVIFCDVVGSTELGERFDPEVMRGVMARFYAAAREPIERHGGTVEKVIGDALVAVFGIPVVREDDALRAVRAALEMRDAVRAMGDIQARIGVNTGDVLARDATPGESLVVGDAVNVAARLEQAAAPGEVLVGAATWALVGHAARGERVAPVAAKGKREPVAAWRLDAVDPSAHGQRRRLDLPMIGREAELDLLRWTLDRTDQTGRPHLVTVYGQPGIGKSRLVLEVPRLAPDLTVLTGQCRATPGASSLEPLLEVARAALPEGADAAATIAGLLPGDPDAGAVAACLTERTAAPDVGWAVSRLIGSMATARTVVIVLEDVHVADDLLLDVVEQLLGRSRRRSLMVVCTARPEFAERRVGWGAGANATSVALERLADAETRRLLAHTGTGLAPDRAERIVAAAEGNPLFAEHLAALVGDDDAPGGLPRSIQVLLTARVEALPEPERQVVAVAAVAGREFPVAAVEAIVGLPIGEELDRLARRELVEPTVAGRQQFGHALLQEAAYALIPKRRRSELHTRLARWLDADGASDAEVGDHLERAHALLCELDANDAEAARIGAEAGTRLAAAGRRADAMGDPRRATRLLQRAVTLLPQRSGPQAAAMIELAAAGWNLHTKDEAHRLLEAGIALAAEHGLRGLELRAQILELGAASGGGPEAPTNAEVLAETEAALRELATLDEPRALATALSTRAMMKCTLGRADDGLRSARRAVRVLQDADEDTVWALSILVWALVESPLPVPAAEALLAELMAQLGVRPAVRSELIQGQAMLALMRGDPDEGYRLLEIASEIEHDLGRSTALGLALTRGLMLVRAGEFEQARRVLPQTITELERRGASSDADIVRCWLGLAEVRLGNAAGARAAVAAAQAAPERLQGYEDRTRARIVLAEVHLAEGDVGHAVAVARDAAAVAATGDWVLLNAEARLTLARALQAAGDQAAAAEQAQAAADIYAAKGYHARAGRAREASPPGGESVGV
jgi:class 3 adenylate cyclase/tetratricopeptide (TPR) repeat protein